MPFRVLLCDDEIHILRAAEFKLQRAGYQVALAFDGLQALESIRVQRPDLVVTDCQMPHLDGLGLVRHLRSHPETCDLPIILLTAKGLELPHDELHHKWRVARVLNKPFSPRELAAVVGEVLAGRDEALELATTE